MFEPKRSQPAQPSVGPPPPAGSQPAAEPFVASVVAEAVRELTAVFNGRTVRAWADSTGGAQVVIEDVPLSDVWAFDTTWVGFAVSHLVPEADTYPHYVRADLAYADGCGLSVPMSPASFASSAAVQVSRRRREGSPVESPAQKTRGVVAWLRNPR